MIGKTSLMLRGNWPGEFRRTVRDEYGKAVKDDKGNEQVLTFQPGQVVELDARQFEAVRDDIGTALWVAKLEKDAKPVPKPDREATNKLVDERNKAKAAEAEKTPAAASAPPDDAPRGRKADLEKKAK